MYFIAILHLHVYNDFGPQVLITLILCILETQTGTLANSEDPDEMQHNAAFHQGLHCLLR